MNSTMPCKLCGAADAVAIPFAIAEKQTRCTACGKTQWVKDYVSDGERMRALVGVMQVKQRDAAFARSGTVACGTCGGEVRLPEGDAVTFPCPWCKAELRVDAYIAPEVLAAEQLRSGFQAMYADSKRTRRNLAVLAVVFGIVAVLGSAILWAIWPRA